MKNFQLKKVDHHLIIYMDNNFFNNNLKKELKKIKSVRVLNAVNISNGIRISIFPLTTSNVDTLEIDVVNRLNQFFLNIAKASVTQHKYTTKSELYI